MSSAVPVSSPRGYGWRPSLPDQRDHQFGDVVALAPTRALPPAASIPADQLPPVVFDQGATGSCTGQACSAAYFQATRRQGRAATIGSRLFLYYNARALEGTVSVDAGATCRDIVKGAARWGAPPEQLWPFVPRRVTTRPPAEAFSQGLRHQALSYAAVAQSSMALRQAIASGHGVLVGFGVYESFESRAVAETGRAPLPGADEQLLGGHLVFLTGYDMTRPGAEWELLNSWGAGWGDMGSFYMPEAYLTRRDLSGDFWALYTTEG